jgi:hypothetical protein
MFQEKRKDIHLNKVGKYTKSIQDLEKDMGMCSSGQGGPGLQGLAEE